MFELLVRNWGARIEGRTSSRELTSYRAVWIERHVDVEVEMTITNGSGSITKNGINDFAQKNFRARLKPR
jgi:hypothetical protein